MTAKEFVRLFLSLLLSLSACVHANACDNYDEDGLDVGLVLSGGGALASTQVGAIELLDELNVPIHCIAGTSFGAVIGGLYASGYSGSEIAEIFRTTPWNEIIVTTPSRPGKSYLQKEQETEYFSGYIAGIDSAGIKLPTRLSSMQELRTFFRRKLEHVPIGSDFDQLNIPFRAIATDLSNGNAHEFSEGDIVEAILASMAVPGAYAPREIDGSYYVDGGMAANLPIQAALDMGADIVIAIDTTVEPPNVESQMSVAGVSQQLIRLAVYQNYLSQVDLLDEEDLLVKPSLEGLATAGFDNTEQAMQSGRFALLAEQSKLIDIKTKAAPAKKKSGVRSQNPEPLIITEVHNDSLISDEHILHRFSNDRSIDIDQKIRNLAAYGGFDEVDLVRTSQGYRLSVFENDLGSTFVQGGVRASNSFNGDSRFSLIGRISRTPISERGGKIDASFELGSDMGVEVRLTYPLGKEGRFFLQPQARYRAQEIFFDVADRRLGEFWQEQLSGRMRVGRELGNWGAVGVDLGAQWGSIEDQVTVLEEFRPVEYKQGGLGVFLAMDTLDRTDWPESGIKGRILADRFYDFSDAEAATDRYLLSALIAKKIGKFGVILNARAEAVANEMDEPIEILRLGGFRRLSAYPENALPNDRYVYSSMEIYRRLSSSDKLLSVPIYAGFIAEYAEAEFDFFENQNFTSSGVYLGTQTPVGPLYLGAAIGRNNASSIFLHLGKSF